MIEGEYSDESVTAHKPGPGDVPREATGFSLLPEIVACAVIVTVVMAQFSSLRDRYLGPDEVFHLSFASPASLRDVYLGSRATPHPPFFFLILHLWMRLGHSELFLRLLPALCGAAFLWVFYRWSARVFGKTAGLLILLLIAFSPALPPLVAEIRGYSLFLLLSAVALAELESGVETRSAGRMAAAGVFLYLAILTHYAALFLVPSFGVYALLRLRERSAPAKTVAAWAVVQTGAVFLYLILYMTHLRALSESVQGSSIAAGSLGRGYFHPDQQSLVSFFAQQPIDVFRYFSGSISLAVFASVFALTGVGLLAMKRHASVWLIAVPFLLGASAGVLGQYPFAGTRHSIYLLPFAAMAIGGALSTLVVGRLWVPVAASLVLVSVRWANPSDAEPQSIGQMNAAIEQLRRRAPPESLLVGDYETSLVFRHYLNRGGNGIRGLAGGYRLVGSPLWAPDPAAFAAEVERVVGVHHLSAGQRFWVIRIGSDTGAGPEIARRFPNASVRSTWTHGGISIIEMSL